MVTKNRRNLLVHSLKAQEAGVTSPRSHTASWASHGPSTHTVLHLSSWSSQWQGFDHVTHPSRSDHRLPMDAVYIVILNAPQFQLCTPTPRPGPVSSHQHLLLSTTAQYLLLSCSKHPPPPAHQPQP